MEHLAERIEDLGIVPVVVIDDAAHSVSLGQVLVKEGLPCAEITFRTAAGQEAIRRLAAELPDLLVGAGTVLKVEQARQAIEAGARFIVAPGFNPGVVDYCLEQGIEVFPGICTPTDIEAALEKGLSILKFFPAEPMGGLDFMKAISAPYGMVRFIPTGGIGPGNLKQYLAFEKTLACGGSWMVHTDWISKGQFDLVSRHVREAVRLVSEVRGAPASWQSE
ncbi:MAG: bifunctional 4-hydroxy-2-oxoglutarate aldolase/2-dehydro-3-deoxy-phosphogluconate aldolase [Acidobacteriota bacterium]